MIILTITAAFGSTGVAKILLAICIKNFCRKIIASVIFVRFANFAVIFFVLVLFLPLRARAAELIYSGDELAEIGARAAAGETELLSAEYVLAADIFLPEGWEPIDGRNGVFSGTLDGAGFEIRGAGALFGVLDGAEIRNLKICGVEIHARGDFGRSEFSAGLLAGEVIGGVIENVEVFGGELTAETLEGGSGLVGGLIGSARDAEIKNVRVYNVRVIADGGAELRAVGGLAGLLENCTVEGSGVFGAEIRANAAAGGFAGIVCGKTVFEDCDASGDVYANGIAGGFAGRVDGSRAGVGAEFLRCRATADVRAATAGGFVGRLSGRSRVAHSHAHGMVVAENAGGFAGEITNASRIEFSSAVSAVYGTENAGGFAAIISAAGAPNTITNSLALGPVVASDANARRFAARLDHDGINNCYAALGMAIIRGEALAHAVPNPFSADGGDIARSRIFSN